MGNLRGSVQLITRRQGIFMVPFWRGIAIFAVAVGLATVSPALFSSSTLAQEGDLNTIRADVRTPPSAAPASSSGPTGTAGGTSRRPYDPNREAVEDAEGMLGTGILLGAGYVVTAPLWAPMNMLGDSMDKVWCYPQFP